MMLVSLRAVTKVMGAWVKAQITMANAVKDALPPNSPISFRSFKAV